MADNKPGIEDYREMLRQSPLFRATGLAYAPDYGLCEGITTDDMARAVAALTGDDWATIHASLREVIVRLAQPLLDDWPEWESGEERV